MDEAYPLWVLIFDSGGFSVNLEVFNTAEEAEVFEYAMHKYAPQVNCYTTREQAITAAGGDPEDTEDPEFKNFPRYPDLVEGE